MGFFKTGPGEYGEGDEFLGLKVPQTREVVKLALTIDHGPLTINEVPELLMSKWHEVRLCGVPELLMSKWHEVRLCGLLILVAKFEKLAAKRLVNDAEAIKKRNEILTMYLQYAERANNWDLVDLSAPKILGAWLKTPSCPPAKGEDWKRRVIDELAQSDNLWKQRMSIVCTWKTSQMGDPSWCLRYAEIHLHHPHDYFLRQHAHEMPRTMLRYAIEKMSEEERKEWMR